MVFPVSNDDYAAAADRLARIVARAPNQLTGFVATHPQRDAGTLDRLIGRAVETHGFRGIKVHGAEAFPSRRLCEPAGRHRPCWSCRNGAPGRRPVVPVVVAVAVRSGGVEGDGVTDRPVEIAGCRTAVRLGQPGQLRSVPLTGPAVTTTSGHRGDGIRPGEGAR